MKKIIYYKLFVYLLVTSLLSSCLNKVEVSVNRKIKNSSIQVSNVKLINNQFVLTGTNLDSAKTLSFNDGTGVVTLQIESKTATSLIANTLSNVTLAAGKVFNFLISSADASSTFVVDFSLCSSTLGGKAIDCSTVPLDKQVLSYDQTSGKWKPRDVNGLTYIGIFDASSGSNPTIKPAGQYYIISVAGDMDAGATVLGVGDWIVSNGTIWQKIDNSTVITSVHGRTGAVVGAEGDYTLTQLGDVTLTAPAANEILKYNGTTWVNTSLSALGGGTVTNVTATAPLGVTNGTSTPALTITQATTSTNGYLSSTDWNTFNGKQASITAGTTAQYYRGDKTFQTLDTTAVAEGSNLYFTNARVLGLALTGFSSATATAITATDSILVALGKAQGQINGLTAGGAGYVATAGGSIMAGTTTVSGVIDATAAGDIRVGTPSGATSATSKGYVDAANLLKLAKAGDTMSGLLTLDADLKIKGTTNYVTLKANTATTTYNFSLPVDGGTNGYVLSTNGSGTTSWIPVASAPVSTVFGRTGAVVAASGDYTATQVTNTAAGNIAATTVQAALNELDTEKQAALSKTSVQDLSKVRIYGANSTNYVELTAATLTGNRTLTFPDSNGSSGYVLSTDGAGVLSWIAQGTAPVSSIFGRTGAVVAASGDYTATQVTNTAAGNIAATTVQAALNELDTEKQAAITKTTVQDVSKVRIYGANSTNYVELTAATLTGNRALSFPDSNGSTGNVLTTDGSGNLSWSSLATSSPVTSVNSLTGAVTLTTTNVAEGTNLYHTDARTLATPITAPTLTNSSIAISDTIQIALGKLQAQFNNILSLAITGYTAGANTALAATDTILAAFGKLQGQISANTTSIGNKADLTNGAQSITASNINITTINGAAFANGNWTTSGSDVYRSGGMVGIGTSAPVASTGWSTTGTKLQVSNAGSLTRTQMAIRNFSASAGFDAILSLGKSNSDTIDVLSSTPANARLGTIAFDGVNSSNASSTAAYIMATQEGATNTALGGNILFGVGVAGVGTSEAMRIASGGYVGIGTTSPGAKLDVSGDISVGSSYESAVAYVNSTAAYTIPDTLSNIRRITLTANTTITLPAFTTPSTKMYTLTLFLKQDATGSRTVTFAGNGADTILWDTNTAPTIASTASKISIIQLTKASDETVWYASQVWKGE